MKRWNGWGNIKTDYPLPETGLDYIEGKLGTLSLQLDTAMDTILATVPESRLPAHPLIDTEPETRLRHARGQSLPDWVALNHGRIEAFPDQGKRTKIQVYTYVLPEFAPVLQEV